MSLTRWLLFGGALILFGSVGARAATLAPCDVVVLSDAPEPGAIGLLGAGLVGFSLILRRRKRA